MPRTPNAFHAVSCVILLLGQVAPASAQQWQGAGEGADAKAFFAQNGRPAGIQFECAPGGVVRTLVAGNGARFPEGPDLTLVLSVDGVARVTKVRAEPEAQGAGSRFVRGDSISEIGDFLSALKQGRELEIAGPAGQLRLPLTGSSKAIARLEAGCRP